ncbi:MAG: nucleotidyltransferase family protein [Clostridia bacterium]|nr:nucleotidyltransferase family protein [Clostridia bacterium]
MRTSCDIDILIHEEDIEKAKSILINEYGYTDHRKGTQDVSLFSPKGIHLELYYDLIADGEANESEKVLKNVGIWLQ